MFHDQRYTPEGAKFPIGSTAIYVGKAGTARGKEPKPQMVTIKGCKVDPSYGFFYTIAFNKSKLVTNCFEDKLQPLPKGE